MASMTSLCETRRPGPLRISVSSSGTQASGDGAATSISGDGRYVTFLSAANNLVAGDTNGVNDIFVRDTQTGTTTPLSIDSGGTQGNGASFESSVSGDGRYVAFFSNASNLVAGDTNGSGDIFLHDTPTGTTTRVSVDSSGIQGDNNSGVPSIARMVGTWPLTPLPRIWSRGTRTF